VSEIDYHRKLLGDRVRNRAFHAALKKLIVPGKTTVLDIGAGTGFLSLLAGRLGARQCTLVEYSDMLDIAARIVEANPVGASYSLIKGHSGELRGLPRFDLVVSETLGNFALEEGMLETLVDARRFVAPRGRLMPMGLKQFVAPVLKPRLQKEIDVWPGVGFDLDLTAARQVALNNMYVKTVRRSEIGEPRQWDAIDFRPSARVPTSLRLATAKWNGRRLRPAVHGFALWWEVELVPGVTISTSPSAPATHWQQIYLPLLEPLSVKAADTLELQLSSDTRPRTGLDVSWKTLHKRGARVLATQQQNIAQGRI
jgi:SAM-dependent methyltransferase